MFSTPMKDRLLLMHSLRIASTVLVGLFIAAAATGVARRGTPSASVDARADVTARIVASAQSLLATLDDAGRAKVRPEAIAS
jgi:hypothetical protein